MAKSIATYWNVLSPEQHHQWQAIPGLEGMAEELTLSIDPESGEYTRLTRFYAGADTTAFGGKSHAYPEGCDLYLITVSNRGRTPEKS